MRKYLVEAFRQCDEPKEPEIIEADYIKGFEGFVEFYENRSVKTWPFGTRNYKYVIAVRQNCNVTEIKEEVQC